MMGIYRLSWEWECGLEWRDVGTRLVLALVVKEGLCYWWESGRDQTIWSAIGVRNGR